MKKKLIALLLAIVMVAALLPSTVISAMELVSADENVANDAGTTTGESSSSANTVVDDNDDVVYEETREVITAQPTKDDYFAIVNRLGDVVGYYATLVDADYAVEDGDTILQLQDYTITAAVRLGDGRNKYQSEANRPNADSELPIEYTIDGNGFKIIANLASGSTGGALVCGENSDGDKLTFKDLFLISSAGGIALNVGSGKGMHCIVENAKIYAGASYWFVDPNFYKGSAYDTNNDGKPEYGTNKLGQGIGIDDTTVNTYLTIKGEDTEIVTWSWEAVKGAGVVEIYDGYFNALDCAQAVWSHIGTAGTSGSSDHKVIIYGGTFVNEKRTCVLASKNAAVYVLGGTFIQTNKDKTTESSCIMTGYDNTHGHAYVAGGTFWLNWLGMSGNPAPVYVASTGAAATVTGGEFYYTSVDRPVSGVDGSSFKLGNYSELTNQAVNLETLTVKTASGEKLITANFHGTVTSTVTPDMVAPEAVAPDKNGNVAEIVIYDANGNIFVALDADADTTNGIWSSAVENGGNEYTSYATVLQEWSRAFYLVPDGGTFSLHADLVTGGSGVMLTAIGDVTFTVQGNGHTVEADYAGKYFCYATGGNVTFLNITMSNVSGRGIQFGNNRHHRHTWILGEGAKVYAGSGSAVYLPAYATLIMKDGSEIKGDAAYKNETANLIQMLGSATFIMEGGKLYCSSNRNAFDSKGFLKDDQDGDNHYVIRAWRTEYNGNDKRVRYIYNGITIKLLGGEIETAHSAAQLLRRQDNATEVDFTIEDTVLKYHEWDPSTEQIAEYTMTAKQTDSVALLDASGNTVCVFDNIAEALPYLQNGYTIKLLTNVVDLHPVRFDLTDIDWTLDLNGYSYYYYAAGQALFYAFGQDQNLLVKNGDMYSISNTLELGTADGKNQYFILENVGVYAGGTSYVNDVGTGSANSYFWVRGYNTRIVFRGEDTVVRGSRRSALISEGAQVEIYDGLFTTHTGFETIKATESGEVAQNTSVRTQGHMTVYGGTFIAGGYSSTSHDEYSRAVVRATFGATVYLVDGNFIFKTAESNGNDAGTNLIRSNSDSRCGYVYVMGGNYYSAYPGRSVYGAGQPALGFIRFFGGTFYSVGETAIVSEKVGTLTQGHHTNFTSYYGTFYDEFYTPVNEQGTYVFGADSGVPAEAQGITYNYKATLTRDDEFVTSTWGNIYATKALRVSYGYTTSEGVVVERSRDLYGYELEAAAWSVGDKGTVALLSDTAWKSYKHTTSTTFPTTSDVAAYAIVLKPVHTSFEWTLTSAAPEGEYYTLEGDANGKYIFFVKGGTLNVENMTLQNISGRVIELSDWYGNKTVVNVQNGGEVSGFSECTFNVPKNVYCELNIRDGGYVNVLDSNIYGDGSGNCTIKHQGNKDRSSVNIYDGGFINYARDGVTPQSGGLTRGDGKGWIAVRMTDNASLLNVYGGKLYGNYNSQNLETDTNRYATILTWGATGGRGSEINVYGGDIYNECGYCLYNGQIDTVVNIYGGYWHNNVSAENHSTWSACRVLHSNSGFVNIYGGKFEKENNCGCQCVQLKRWASGDEDGWYNIFGGEFIGGNDTFAFGDTARVTMGGKHPITGEDLAPTISGATSAMIGANANSNGILIINDVNIIGNGKQAIYCGDMPIVINGGNFGDATHRVGVGLNVLHNTSSSDITINGGTFYCSGHFMDLRGNGVRDIIVNNAHVDTDACVTHWNPNDTYAGNPSNVVFNGGYFTNATNDSGWGIFNDTSNKSLNTKLTINGGEFYHAGGSRMMKWYGHGTININGGYFWNNSTSDLFQTEASIALQITVTGGEFVNTERARAVFYMDGAGYLIFKNGVDANGNVTTPKLVSKANDAIRMYADNMPLLIQNVEIEAAGVGILLDTANASIAHVINSGTVKTQGYALQTAAANLADTVINGGSFSAIKGNDGPDACISIAGGKCTINAGYFETNGMCVARVLGGSTDNEFNLNGSIKTESTAILEINGGVLRLLESGRNYDYDAVIRVGGGSTYGWVYLNGGTFICESTGAEAVINKNNVHGNLYVNGGVYLTSGNQITYFRTSGNVNGSAYPFAEPIYVDTENDMTMNYGGVTYYALLLNLADSEDAPVTQVGAQVRLTGDNMGIRFVSRISAETVAKYAAMSGVTVSYGTLIAPLDYILEAGGNFTAESLAAVGLCAADIKATESGTVYNADGSITIRAALTNIKAENRDRAFGAVAYIQIEDAEGNVTRVYGEFNGADHVRSLSELATKSLDDVQDLYGAYGNVRYIYESIVHEGKFCRYTVAQQQALLACIPAYDAE